MARLIPLVIAAALLAGEPLYRSASVDAAGRLHVIADSGRQILPRKIEGQVAFGSPLVSPDRRTVGWLVMYPGPFSSEPIAGRLALFQAGHVIHTFTTEQVFWDWQFRDGGRRVAYSTGPTHGGAAECVLREVESGRVVARWRVIPDGTPPPWARDLRQ